MSKTNPPSDNDKIKYKVRNQFTKKLFNHSLSFTKRYILYIFIIICIFYICIYYYKNRSN